MRRPSAGRPSTGRLYWRAVTLRCPVCGEAQLFRRWVTMVERCPHCGLRFERVEGHWTGALGINTVLSFGLLLVTLLGGFLLTYPEVPAVGLVVASVGVAALGPVFFFPFSKTVWLAIDLQMRGPGPDEVASDYAWGDGPAHPR